MANNFSNVAQPLYVRSALNNSDSSSTIQVSSTPGGGQEDGSSYGWPTAPFFVIIDPNTASQEVVKVASKSGSSSTTQYSITRGSSLGSESYGSTTKSHNAWAIIYPIWSAADSYNASVASDVLFGGKTVTNQTASNVALTIKEAAGQSAAALSIKNSSDVEYFKIDASGNITATKATMVARFKSTSGASSLVIDGAAGTDRQLVFSTGVYERWKVLVNTTAESGSNAGSNFGIYSVSDDGLTATQRLSISRNTGEVSIPSTFSVTGASTFSSTLTAATVPSANGHLTNKLYVDNALALKLNLSGGTLSGGLTIPNANLAITGTGALSSPSGTFTGALASASLSLLSGVVGNNQILIGQAHSQTDGVLTANMDGSSIIYLASTSNSGFARLRGYRASGANYAARSAIGAGAEALALDACGYGSSIYSPLASIELGSDTIGTRSNTSMPGRIIFKTTPDGSVTPLDRLIIDSTGLTTITGNTYITNKLTVGSSGVTPSLELGVSGPRYMAGTGGPSGISAPVGSTWRQTDANASHGSLTGLLWNKVGTGTTEGTDWLVDFEGRWVDYTPTWTNVSMSSTAARYTRSGKQATFRCLGVLSAAPTGDVAVTSPTSMSSTVNQSHMGPVRSQPNYAWPGFWAYASSSTMQVYFFDGSGHFASLSSTQPETWASGDWIALSGTYEIA